MGFLAALSDAVLDRSPTELIGAVLIAAAFAILIAGLYALCRRKSNPSPTLMGGLTVAAGIACMAVSAGYLQYLDSESIYKNPAMGRADASRPRMQPWDVAQTAWSPGFHLVVAADEDHDGRLTARELEALLLKADIDDDGAVNFVDLDRAIASRFRFTSLPGNPPTDQARKPPPIIQEKKVDRHSDLPEGEPWSNSYHD